MHPMIYPTQAGQPAIHDAVRHHAIMALIVTAISLPLGLLMAYHAIPMPPIPATPMAPPRNTP